MTQLIYKDPYITSEFKGVEDISSKMKILDKRYSELNLNDKIDRYFNGDIVNKSENQSALHFKYREEFSNQVESKLRDKNIYNEGIDKCISYGELFTKKGIKNIVTIGIGGSFEGPKLLIEALVESNNSKFNHFFVTGSDRSEFYEKVSHLNREETFFVVSSKSLSTDESLDTLKLAINWINQDSNMDNFIVVTSNPNKALEMNFAKEHIITFPKEIGGRFSIWSPISFSSIIELGSKFMEFLNGGFNADLMLKTSTEFKSFIKHLSFTDIIYNNYFNMEARVVLSYSWKLRSFTDYIQQLEMESLGKRPNPESIFKKTGQIIFGGYGPTAQHSYFQLIHQGTAKLCADIIKINNYDFKNELLNAQAMAQAEIFSKKVLSDISDEEMVNSKTPVNLISLEKLNAFNLGYLLAIWEYRTFLTSLLLQINAFDQFGVAAGKIVTKKFLSKNEP